jgi:protein arginine N-methyltransferase 1
MIANSPRTDAYVGALKSVVDQESIVLDIGTGTGIFAFLAQKFGAKKVFAIEPSNVIYIAKLIAAKNRFDRIDFIQGYSTNVHLPEKVDVIISDVRGILPFHKSSIESIIDARRRFLKPGGILIPQSDTLMITVVSAEALYKNDYCDPWQNSPYGIDMELVKETILQSFMKAKIKPEQMIFTPQALGTTDYRTVEDENFSGTVKWQCSENRTAHGLCIWFDTTLFEEFKFTNSPEAPRLVYGVSFFPWLNPVSLQKGDLVRVSIAATRGVEDYIWNWESRILTDSGEQKAHFKQSTFFGVPLSRKALQKHALSYRPILTEEGRLDALILSMMSQSFTVEEIAQRAYEEFPNLFRSFRSSVAKVAAMSQHYSQD